MAGDSPTIVLELPFVSQRISAGRAPPPRATVRAIEAAMRRHGIATATFVGHSLGSVYLSWVAKLRPDLASSFVFIDPIVFLLHHVKVSPLYLPYIIDPIVFLLHHVKVAHSFLYETIPIPIPNPKPIPNQGGPLLPLRDYP